MSSSFDEGGFHKARSLLLATSTLILTLWYFSVNLNAISILGNSIQFTENREQIWLVLSLCNMYLLLRYAQQLPTQWFCPTQKMQLIFRNTLTAITATCYRSQLLKVITDEQKTHLGNIIVKDKPQSSILTHQSGAPLPKEKAKLNEIYFLLASKYGEYDRNNTSPTHITTTIIPARPLIWFARLFSYFKASFITIWFTEFVLPIIYAIAAIVATTMKWWEMNHLMKYALKSSFNQTLIPL